MLKPTEGNLAHAFIIKDLVVRTLELDLERLVNLKGGAVYVKLFVRVIKEQRTALLQLKNDLAVHRVIYQGAKKAPEDITLYYFVQNGAEHEYRYSNLALRNQTFRELEVIFGVEDKK